VSARFSPTADALVSISAHRINATLNREKSLSYENKSDALVIPAPTVIPAPPSFPPHRHSRPTVIPAPPSFPRRRESTGNLGNLRIDYGISLPAVLPKQESSRQTMRDVHAVYVVYFNSRTQSSGHVMVRCEHSKFVVCPSASRPNPRLTTTHRTRHPPDHARNATRERMKSAHVLSRIACPTPREALLADARPLRRLSRLRPCARRPRTHRAPDTSLDTHLPAIYAELSRARCLSSPHCLSHWQ